MTLVFLLDNTGEVNLAIDEVINSGLIYGCEIVPVTYGIIEASLKCDPSDAASIENILAPVM